MRCPNCNQELPDDSIFCDECGINIQKYIKKKKINAFIKKYEGRLTLLLALLVLIAGGSKYLYQQSTKYNEYYELARGFIDKLNETVSIYTDEYELEQGLIDIQYDTQDYTKYCYIYADISYDYNNVFRSETYKMKRNIQTQNNSEIYEDEDIEISYSSIDEILDDDNTYINEQESSPKSNEYVYNSKYSTSIFLCNTEKFIEWGSKEI